MLIYIDEALGILFIGVLYTKYYKNKWKTIYQVLQN